MPSSMTTTLITGGAGFIGSQLALRLLAQGERVVILDNVDSYYDPAIKRANLSAIRLAARHAPENAIIVEGDIRDAALLHQLFSEHSITRVANLAAMSGVRYSADHAPLYVDVNVHGATNVMDVARQYDVQTLVLASTSNVYGDTARVPFVEDDPCIAPLAPYPASKRAAELLAHSLHHLYGLNITVLRFFNVYGPPGRPDMIPMRAIDAIVRGQPLPVYGGGDLQRDWTYIDDIIDGIVAALNTPLGFQILNLGCGAPLSLNDFLVIYERLIGTKAVRQEVTTPLTELSITYCDNTRARTLLGFNPKIGIEEGLARTWAWYQARYGMKG